ncbi:MAG: hypothetical protein MOGMAGMI_00680 [Candidatus Omnitrophica bacterium]|nr:hypothetical protein [Candidatus Omnitrophota bacterium]
MSPRGQTPPSRRVAARLGRVSALWRRREYPPRLRAVRDLGSRARYSRSQSNLLIDALFANLSTARLSGLLKAVRKTARIPQNCVQIHASNSPQPAVEAVALSLLVGCAVIVRPSASDPGLLRHYVNSLRKEDPALGRAVRWLEPRDKKGLRKALANTPLVIAYGSDETLESLRRRLGPWTRLAEHGHRVSSSVLTAEALRNGAVDTARRTALDIWMDRQQGCLSPRVVYVEGGGGPCLRFAEILAGELEKLTREDPLTSPSERAAAGRLRRLYRMRAALGERIAWHERMGQGRYAVMYDEKLSREPDPFVPLCVCVKAFKSRAQLIRKLRRLSGHIQGIALAASGRRRTAWIKALSPLKASIITVPGKLQFPPLDWQHDNKPRLYDWLS